MRYYLVWAALLVGSIAIAGAVFAAWRQAHVPVDYAAPAAAPSPPLLKWQKTAIGKSTSQRPRITNVQVVDFDRDGKNDVLVCDPQRNAVICYLQSAKGWDERVLGNDLLVPAHATLTDIDGDGDSDVLVSELGDIWPSDQAIGRLILLENQGGRKGFRRHVLLDAVRRVADAQPGDFDGDGDMDIAVAVFGYARGEVLWLENRGEFRFREHRLWARPGAIHVPVADFDGDGDLDIAAVISQDDEEVLGFENDGKGNFERRSLFATINFDLGSAGLVLADLDRDGDADLLLPAGDNLEENYAWPQAYHGCFWLENRGAWKFETHRIATFGAAYAAAPGDLDGDGDLDVALVSLLNDWSSPSNPSVVWLENDGRQKFQLRPVDIAPTHLVTVSCGDLNGDGKDDIVAGGMHIRPPYDRTGRVSAWLSVP